MIVVWRRIGFTGHYIGSSSIKRKGKNVRIHHPNALHVSVESF